MQLNPQLMRRRHRGYTPQDGKQDENMEMRISSGDPARHSRHLKLISMGVSYGYERLKNDL
jgi:hypothetical protein